MGQTFDEIVQENLTLLSSHAEQFQTTLDLLRLQQGQRCVFVGSGRSLLPLEFALRGTKVLGLYMDPENVEFQRYVSQLYKGQIQSAVGELDARVLDIMATPLRELPNGFDVVHCVNYGGRDADWDRDDFVHTLFALGNGNITRYLVSKFGGPKGIGDPYAAFLVQEAKRVGMDVRIIAPNVFASEVHPYSPAPLIELGVQPSAH